MYLGDSVLANLHQLPGLVADLLRAFAIEREHRFGVRKIHDLPRRSALQVLKSSELDFRFRPLIFFTFEPTREPLICGHTARVGVAVAIIGFEHG